MSTHLRSKQRTPRFLIATRMFAVICLAIGGYLVLSDPPTNEKPPGELPSLSQTSRSQQRRSCTTCPIETIRVGDRVLARNPEVDESERANWTEPEWESWLHLSLQMPLEPRVSGRDPATLQIELLRPESWIRDRLAIVAGIRQAETLRASIHEEEDETALVGTTSDAVASVPHSPLRPIFHAIAFATASFPAEGTELVGLTLDIDLPEMGACGTAVITDLRPCPAVKQGGGQVVTATFAHPPSRQVLDVAFEGEPNPIGVTDNHRFWSVERQKFMAIGQMNVGERVQTYHGDTKRISGKLPRPGPQTVYNLEVYGEHVYFVGEAGLLAHNAYGSVSKKTADLAEANRTRSGKAVLGHFPGYIEKAKGRGASYFDIGTAWDTLTPAERWAANAHFLDLIADSGDQVLLSLPKTKIRPTSYLTQEIRYLIETKGYKWINQWSLRKR